jgi:hypothetical protein
VVLAIELVFGGGRGDDLTERRFVLDSFGQRCGMRDGFARRADEEGFFFRGEFQAGARASVSARPFQTDAIGWAEAR